MRGVARSLAVLMAVGLATVTVVDAIVPAAGDEGVVSVTLMITILGLVAVGQLLSSVMRTNPEAWRRVPALWSRPTSPQPGQATSGDRELGSPHRRRDHWRRTRARSSLTSPRTASGHTPCRASASLGAPAPTMSSRPSPTYSTRQNSSMTTDPLTLSVAEVGPLANSIVAEVERVIVGKRPAIELVLAGWLADGHVLIEDLPGLAKTLLARSLAQVTDVEMNRVQFTPDLMPSDVTGSSIWDPSQRAFEFRSGPIFANLVLGDEINRAPPKTQAAMLEAMAERQVTVDGTTHRLPRPFLVMATQNPVEFEGTYPLPEAQLDRFLVRASIGYPDARPPNERSSVDGSSARSTTSSSPVWSIATR
jgi:hypothetical protein